MSILHTGDIVTRTYGDHEGKEAVVVEMQNVKFLATRKANFIPMALVRIRFLDDECATYLYPQEHLKRIK